MFGDFVEKVLVVKEESTTVQVVVHQNTETKKITVIDNKTLTVTKDEVITHPVTFISVIPAPLIASTATKITEISTIIAEVKATTKKEVVFESITIEDFGSVKKFIAVQATADGKQEYIYLMDKTTEKLQLIESFVATTVETLVYEETTNKFGEKTVISNSVTEVTAVISEVSSGIKFITTKYPGVTTDHIELIQAVEYPSFYQTQVTIQTETTESVTIVVNIEKETKAVTEVSTFSSSDIHVETIKDTTTTTTTPSGPVVHVPTNSPVVVDVVKFVE